MASLLDKVKAAVANNTLKPANYKDAIFASRNDPEVISFLQSIASQTAPSVASSSPVSLFNQAAKKTSGYPDLRDRTSPLGSVARVLTGETPIVNPYLFNGVTRPVSEATKQVDMRNRNAQVAAQNQAMGNAAQALGGIFSGDGRTAENTAGTTNTTGAGLASLLPMIQGRSPAMVGSGIQSTVAPDASSPEVSTGRRGGRGSTPVDSTLIVGGRSRGDRESTGFVNPLESLSQPTSPKDQGGRGTGARNVPPPVVKEEKKTEKTEDLTPEAKTFNTGATVVSPQEPEAKKDWFNAINDRIDLMAMGAAMLAGSGQRGATTMSRLGEGLQAGLASRAAEAKDAEDKQYKDALLLLKTMDQRRLLAKDKAAGVSDPFKNYSSKINDLSASLVGLNVPQDQAKAIAETIFANTDGRIMDGDANQRNELLKRIIKRSTGMFDIGAPDVELTKIPSALSIITKPNEAK